MASHFVSGRNRTAREPSRGKGRLQVETPGVGVHVDTRFRWDLLDRCVEERAEVSADETLVTDHRYDANGN